MLIIITIPPGMEKLAAIHEILEKSPKDLLRAFSEAEMSLYRFMVEDLHRYSFSNPFPGINPLGWSKDPIGAIDYLAEKNSPLLKPALKRAEEIIQTWSDNREDQFSLNGEYRAAVDPSLSMKLYRVIQKHATSEQESSKTFKYYLARIEDIKHGQVAELDQQRQDLLNLWDGPAI